MSHSNGIFFRTWSRNRVQNAFNIRREGLNDGFDLARPQQRSCILYVLCFEASAAQITVACAFASLCLPLGTTKKSIFLRLRCTQGQNNKHRQGEAGRCWIHFHGTYHGCREASKLCVHGRLNTERQFLFVPFYVCCLYGQEQCSNRVSWFTLHQIVSGLGL